jgi:hypothetical protein
MSVVHVVGEYSASLHKMAARAKNRKNPADMFTKILSYEKFND